MTPFIHHDKQNVEPFNETQAFGQDRKSKRSWLLFWSCQLNIYKSVIATVLIDVVSWLWSTCSNIRRHANITWSGVNLVGASFATLETSYCDDSQTFFIKMVLLKWYFEWAFYIIVFFTIYMTIHIIRSVGVTPRYPSHLWHVRVAKISFLTHWGRDKNGRYVADDIFKCIFLNENAWISLKISLKFVPKVRIDNIPALV